MQVGFIDTSSVQFWPTAQAIYEMSAKPNQF
jgi:hypothetical protein